jgi:hypothetical protein
MDKKILEHWLQVAAWSPHMICNIYLLKNHEIANNSTTSKFGEKKSTDLESVGF